MLFTAIVFFITANIFMLCDILNIGIIGSAIIFTVLFIGVNFKPCFGRLEDKKSQAIRSGVAVLEAFLIAATGSVALLFVGIFVIDFGTKGLIINSVIAFLVLALAFWNGIIRIYISARQLGIKWRVIGAACGMIPVVNIIVLMKLIALAKREYKTENEKELVNLARQGDMICKTKYPILLVHGVFFRDFEHFNYWGRIPKELERNGAVIYYGGQQSALSVADSAAELADKIRKTVEESGCEKVNIIAHSKGGLDSRWAISNLGCDRYVASLTTVNTPHRGCKFADYLLSKAGEGLRAKVSGAYNASAKKLGDTEPDFIAAVTDLTASACEKINEQCPDKAGVFYQSIGSRSVKASAGRFPLNLSYLLVDHFDGPNDGLVSVDSMVWGESFREYKPEGSRGISHGDMIDLNRENIDGFDVREAYVELVSQLAKKGY
ncbi:MAG: triacylglycerol lipase [Ruminococcus sp.]|nr:triacylglycerol lipase [Ruminococcus sp.]